MICGHTVVPQLELDGKRDIKAIHFKKKLERPGHCTAVIMQAVFGNSAGGCRTTLHCEQGALGWAGCSHGHGLGLGSAGQQELAVLLQRPILFRRPLPVVEASGAGKGAGSTEHSTVDERDNLLEEVGGDTARYLAGGLRSFVAISTKPQRIDPEEASEF